MPDGGSGAETGGCGKGNVGRASGGRFKDDNRLEVLGAKLGMGLKRRRVINYMWSLKNIFKEHN